MKQNNSVLKAPEITATGQDINEDPDWQFKPILKGVINTRTDYDATSCADWGEGY